MKNKLTKVLCLTTLVASLCGGVAYARNGSNLPRATEAEQIKSQNTRHKTPHSDRKSAAMRLKMSYTQQRQERPNDFDKVHQEHQRQKGHTKTGGMQ
ncbi:MAG: hypothetical protein NTX38_15440 [Methylobacter sp.]|nr:hypothetical protein [Methylobacter sp.]